MSDKKQEDNVLNIIGIAAGVIPTIAAASALAPFVKSTATAASTAADPAMINLYIQFYNQAKYIYRI